MDEVTLSRQTLRKISYRLLENMATEDYPHTTVSNLIRLKDQSPTTQMLTCEDCTSEFVGYTRRRLQARIQEHKNAYNKGMINRSAVAVAHCLLIGHDYAAHYSTPAIKVKKYTAWKKTRQLPQQLQVRTGLII